MCEQCFYIIRNAFINRLYRNTYFSCTITWFYNYEFGYEHHYNSCLCNMSTQHTLSFDRVIFHLLSLLRSITVHNIRPDLHPSVCNNYMKTTLRGLIQVIWAPTFRSTHLWSVNKEISVDLLLTYDVSSLKRSCNKLLTHA